MNSQEFLFLYIAIAGAFALWYWSSRKQKTPTQLNLKAKDTAPILMEAIKEQDISKKAEDSYKSLDKGLSLQQAKSPKRDYSQIRFGKIPAASAAPKERELNIVFNYNGHSWDAHEVLGIPAGASFSQVTAAYQTAIQNSDPESHEFLKCAFQAIMDRRTL
ncbi:MAG: hypothetical protein ACLGGX_11970 [Bdellovibrionia bacterium]